ncbi:hypothetical protein SXANM310S_05747 [Streptomyces xanthochromogenes]
MRPAPESGPNGGGELRDRPHAARTRKRPAPVKPYRRCPVSFSTRTDALPSA